MSMDSLDKTNLILDLISKKQQVIGANLSNINTPGYVRQEIDFSQVIGTLNSPLETKLSKKLGPSPVLNDGNGPVSAQQELVEMQKNNLYYAVAARRMTSTINEIKTVMNVGK